MNFLHFLVINLMVFGQSVFSDEYSGIDAYMGCFVDNRLARDLDKLPGYFGNVWIDTNSKMTIESCLNLCRSFSLPYAGLEFSNECYCGDAYGRYGQATDFECNYRCSGNSAQTCGGLNRISVYSVRILIRTDVLMVLNVSSFDFSPLRLVQTWSAPNLWSWIEYSKEEGKIKIFNNNNEIPLVLNALRAQLASNNFFIFLSLKANRLAVFNNCQLTDTLTLNDSSLTQTFLSPNTIPILGEIKYNGNINDIFTVYGCVNFQDASQQISQQSNILINDYCKLSLADIQMTNLQIGQVINNISKDLKSSQFLLDVIQTNYFQCIGQTKRCQNNFGNLN